MLAYADSYRDMAKKGVESVPIWSVITDLERNIAPLYRHVQTVKTVQPVMFIDGDISTDDADKLAKVIREFNEEDERPLAKMARIIRENPHPTNECDMPKAQPAPVVPDGLRLALSNAGIAAPESDEMLAATCEKHIQALVTWVKDRKPFQSAPVVPEEIKRNPETGWYVGPDGKNWSALQANSWNACRAAMLASATQSPGSEPATVSGEWIPVSESLPEDSGRYWCYVEEQNDLGKSHYQWNCSWNGDRWWVESEGSGIVTHWMPLPEAPQE